MNDDNAFELDTNSICGPSPRGSLHASVTVDLDPATQAVPEPELAAPPPIEVSAVIPPPREPLKPRPLVSFVVSTYNRREVLLKTVEHIDRCGLKSDEFETIIVDNASTDGTAAAVRQAYPLIHLLHQEYNTGPVSKNIAVRSTRGRNIDLPAVDSYPRP